ncbi:MAG: toprim domain-containing protein, partial [Limisphaerales bacterium]
QSAIRFYDRFRGRLIFPIFDEQGRVIGFSGRILSGDEKIAKYVNSPETPIFTKSKIFFGLDKSKRAILDAGFAIICEGQLDLIACFMAGIQNIVAPQGTAFTDQHARILKRYVNEVVLCFDSDEAGQNAAVRSLDHLLVSGLAVRVAVVPAPHDPDSFIKKFSNEKFQELIKNAEGFFDYYLKRLRNENDEKTDKGRMQIVSSMLIALHKTNNRVLIDKHAHDLTFQLGLSFSSIRNEYQKIANENFERPISSEQPLESTEPKLSRPTPSEFHLLKLLLLHDELVGWTSLHLDVNWISNPLARKIIAQRLAAQKNETWKTLAAFLDECDSVEMRNLVTEAVAEERKIPNPETQLADVTLKLRNQFLDRQISALTQKASQPEISDADKIALLREQQKLREQKRSPLSQFQN